MHRLRPGQILTGKKFKELNKGQRLVKLTNQTENHNGYKFNTGVNIDHIQFNPSKICSAGGFYFCTFLNFHKYLRYHSNNETKKCVNIRNVIIPDDAKVYIEEDKFKVDKFLLQDPIKIYEIPKTCKHVVRNNSIYLEYIENQTNILCLEAVKQNGLSLKYVKKQTPKICLTAVRQNGLAIKFVKHQTPVICSEAVRQNPRAINYIKDNRIILALNHSL